MLSIETGGQTRHRLETRLANASTEAMDLPLNKLRNTGVLLEEQDARLRLIDLFWRWHANEIGFVPHAMRRRTSVVEPNEASPVASPTVSQETVQTTELTFLPDEDVVLIKRGRFLILGAFRRSRHSVATIRQPNSARSPPGWGPLLRADPRT